MTLKEGFILICLMVALAVASSKYSYTQKKQLLQIPADEEIYHLELLNDELKVVTNQRRFTINLVKGSVIGSSAQINGSKVIGEVIDLSYGTLETDYDGKCIRFTDKNGNLKLLPNGCTGSDQDVAPFQAVFGKNGEIVYTMERENKVVSLNPVTLEEVVIASDGELIRPRGLVYNAEKDTFYVTMSNGIFSTKERKLLSGVSDEFDFLSREGDMQSARFMYPTSIISIEPSVLLVAEYVGNVVKVIDITDKNVYTLCSTKGDCIFKFPNALAYSKANSRLYVADSDGVWELELPKTTDKAKAPNLCYGLKKSGVTEIQIEGQKMQVWCDIDTEGGPWIVLMKRFDGSVDFAKDFIDYQKGFGDVSGEHWLGLENMYLLTKNKQAKLRIDLEQFARSGDGRQPNGYAIYNQFWIGDVSTDYTLEEIDGYSGDAGDMETTIYEENTGGPHRGQKFSTKDRDFDEKGNANCADSFNGGWWMRQCFTACLTCGPYRTRPKLGFGTQMIYSTFTKGKIALKASSMKIHLPEFLA